MKKLARIIKRKSKQYGWEIKTYSLTKFELKSRILERQSDMNDAILTTWSDCREAVPQ